MHSGPNFLFASNITNEVPSLEQKIQHGLGLSDRGISTLVVLEVRSEGRNALAKAQLK